MDPEISKYLLNEDPNAWTQAMQALQTDSLYKHYAAAMVMRTGGKASWLVSYHADKYDVLRDWCQHYTNFLNEAQDAGLVGP
jgi:hypothetical protein